MFSVFWWFTFLLLNLEKLTRHNFSNILKIIFMRIFSNFQKLMLNNFTKYFHQSGPLGRFGLLVAMFIRLLSFVVICCVLSPSHEILPGRKGGPRGAKPSPTVASVPKKMYITMTGSLPLFPPPADDNDKEDHWYFYIFFCKKKMLSALFLTPAETKMLVLLCASVKRFGVSRKPDFFDENHNLSHQTFHGEKRHLQKKNVFLKI